MHVGAQLLLSGSHGQGPGPIFLSELFCDGTESSLFDCVTQRSQPPSTFMCDHSQDVAISCRGMLIISTCYKIMTPPFC